VQGFSCFVVVVFVVVVAMNASHICLVITNYFHCQITTK